MIALPESLHFAEVEGSLGSYCVVRDGDDTVLCGRELLAVTPDGWGPEEWTEVHRECVRALLALGKCPVCGRWVETENGRIQGHGESCLGVNLKPHRGNSDFFCMEDKESD